MQDRTAYKYSPGPRTIVDGKITSLLSPVRVAGASTTGYSNLPSSWSQSQSWIRKYRKTGARVLRPHHIDKMLLDNAAHKDRFQLFLNAGRYYGVPAILEACSEAFDKSKLAQGDFTQWYPYLDLLFGMDLSNVVMMTPVNEPHPTSPEVFAMQVKELRKRGYKGIVFGSNANIQGGEYGDCEDSHNYTGLPEFRDGKRYVYNCAYPEWSSKREGGTGELTYLTNLPRIVTECGMLAGPQRGASDVRFYEDCIEKKIQKGDEVVIRNVQVTIAFAFCTDASDWNSNTSPERDYNAFINEPVRMEAFGWFVDRLNGLEKAEVYPTSPTFVG